MAADPKHITTRARRNIKSTRATLANVMDPDSIEIPPMPRLYKKVWVEEAQDWVSREMTYEQQSILAWETWWQSPMRQEWTQADYIGLCRLIILEDAFWKGSGEHSEIRLAQKDYGLTPLDRRRLEWTIESSEKAKEDGNKRRARGSHPATTGDETSTAPQATGGDGDPRLYAIDGGQVG